jgi:hypothetical protein
MTRNGESSPHKACNVYVLTSARREYDHTLSPSSNWGQPRQSSFSTYGTYPSSSPSFSDQSYQSSTYTRPQPSGPHRAWSQQRPKNDSPRDSPFDFPNMRYGPTGSSGGYGGPQSHFTSPLSSGMGSSRGDPFASLGPAVRNAWKQEYQAHKQREKDRKERDDGDDSGGGVGWSAAIVLVVLCGGLLFTNVVKADSPGRLPGQSRGATGVEERRSYSTQSLRQQAARVDESELEIHKYGVPDRTIKANTRQEPACGNQ